MIRSALDLAREVFDPLVNRWLASCARKRQHDRIDHLNTTPGEEDDLVDLLAEAIYELVQQQNTTIKRLNRRCQQAEAAARENVEACQRQGVSMGRGLANWAASHYRDQLEDG